MTRHMKTCGYIWYVDTEYPIPQIGFYTNWNKTLYLDTGCGTNNVRVDTETAVKHYRFGEEITKPDTQTNEIE